MVNMVSGGGAAARNTGFIYTKDQQSVRHEQPLKEQTDLVRTGAYEPRKKLPPESAEQRRTRLVKDPTLVDATIAKLESALARLEASNQATQRPLSHKIGRAAKAIVSAPDHGNVKANRSTAVRLSARPGSAAALIDKLRTKTPQADADAPAPGYASLDEHREAMTAVQKQRYVGRLRQEASELHEELTLAHEAAKQVHTAAPVAYRSAREEIRLNGGRSADALVSAETSLAETQARQASANSQELARERHAAVFAAHANAVLPPALHKLDQTLARLNAAEAREHTSASAALAALKASQDQEIDHLIATLPGFTIGPGQEQKADLLRQHLRETVDQYLDKPPDLEAHEIPAPLLMHIFVSGMADAAGADIDALPMQSPADTVADSRSSISSFMSESFESRVLTAVRSLPGGLLAAEQLTGTAVKDKEKRMAARVEARAAYALANQFGGAADPDGTAPASGVASTALALPDSRQRVLQAAQEAARMVAAGRGAECDELQQAAFQAVRNGLFLEPGNAGDSDKHLKVVQERLNKFLGVWVERAADRTYAQGPLLAKSPLNSKPLSLANKTSTLGYDAPERPMARMDATLKKVTEALGACLPHFEPATLTQGQTVQLAAVLVAADKATADKNLRPGQITLGLDDLPALTAKLAQQELRSLTRAEPAPQPGVADPGAGEASCPPALAQAARDLLNANGSDGVNVTDSLVLAPFVASIAGHIEPDDAASEQRKASLLKNAGVVRDMSNTELVDKITSLHDLYNFLEPKIQQFELRGKIKITSGGNVGGSTKLLTFPVDVAQALGGDLVLPVRGEIKGNRARGAVFEIGFSTTGFEIFIGSETRTAGAGGVGTGFRIGFEDVLSSGAGVDKTLSKDRADTEGVWLRLPRNGDDEATRAEALALLKTLFDVDGAHPARAADDARLNAHLQHDDGSNAMPMLVGQLLARHPNLSISVVDKYREKNGRNELSGNAALLNVKTGTGESGRFGLLTAGAKTERRNKRFEQSDATGFMQIRRSNALSGGIAYMQAGVLSVGLGADLNETGGIIPGLGNGFTYARQIAEKGIDTKLRYITRDGETNAVDTRVDYENLNFDNHVERVNLDRRAWLETGVKELFKPAPGKTLPPLNEQMRVAEHWLDSMLEQARAQSKGNARHVYSLSYSLLKTAAATIDGMRAKSELARRAGREEEAGKIDVQIDELLQHPAAWQPWKVTASERTSEKEQQGINFAFVLGTHNVAEGQRGLNSYPK